jgi:DNA ligase (NAD+)
VVAKSVLDYFASPSGVEILARLRGLGIRPGDGAAVAAFSDNALAGKIFVLTGSLSQFSRQEATERIRALGGSVTSSVTKNTDFVVAGEEAGSKLEAALRLQIPVLGEQAFLDLIGRSLGTADSPPALTFKPEPAGDSKTPLGATQRELF